MEDEDVIMLDALKLNDEKKLVKFIDEGGLTEAFVISFCTHLYEHTMRHAINYLKTAEKKAEEDFIAKHRFLASSILSPANYPRITGRTLQILFDAMISRGFNLHLEKTKEKISRDMKKFYHFMEAKCHNMSEMLGRQLSDIEVAECANTYRVPLVLQPPRTDRNVGDRVLVSIKNRGWVHGKIKKVNESSALVSTKSCGLQTVSFAFIAYLENALSTNLQVGSRVAARRLGTLHGGLVGEPPNLRNSFRYLIFFDDRCAHYCSPNTVHQSFDDNLGPPKFLDVSYKEFLRQYLASYPERPMVRLQIGSVIAVEFFGCWISASVSKIDCSMMLVDYTEPDGRKRSEWLYRGSPRLQPLNRVYYHAAPRRAHASQHLSKARCSSMIVYMHDTPGVNFDVNTVQSSILASECHRKKARLGNMVGSYDEQKQLRKVSISEIGIKNFRIENHTYIPHECSPKCVIGTEIVNSVSNPLHLPMACGWLRIVKTLHPSGRQIVEYRAPCGRSLRRLSELDNYLSITNSTIEIDRFSFDVPVRTDVEYFSLVSPLLAIEDITEGRENVPVSCINCIDNSLPEKIDYQPVRIPMEGVPLNTSIEFLEGCDCTDGCRNRDNCACWQKTLEGVRTINRICRRNKRFRRKYGRIPNGYLSRRLWSCIQSGVFECNARCKCDSRCLNRVVQNGITAKLQLFKTETKGWGLRTLCDLPKGTFICTYTGHVLTDEQANERGRDGADDYFADLDFVDTIEETKYSPDSGKSVTLDDIRTFGFEPAYRNPYNNPVQYRSLVNDPEVYIMDGKICGNVGRYLNHSCEPNVFVQNVLVDTYDMRFPWIAFFTNQIIKAGEELCWDYQYDVDSVPHKKIICNCGTPGCRGRLL